jgi:hypothetical protein
VVGRGHPRHADLTRQLAVARPADPPLGRQLTCLFTGAHRRIDPRAHIFLTATQGRRHDLDVKCPRWCALVRFAVPFPSPRNARLCAHLRPARFSCASSLRGGCSTRASRQSRSPTLRPTAADARPNPRRLLKCARNPHRDPEGDRPRPTPIQVSRLNPTQLCTMCSSKPMTMGECATACSNAGAHFPRTSALPTATPR